MTPIVRVIAHTTFLGVPPDLLPTDKARKQQEQRYTHAFDAFKVAGDPTIEPNYDAYLGRVVIEAEARRLVTAAGQDQGTDAERLIECAGRACYSSFGAGRPSNEYHEHILDVNHGSVEEHAWITFFLGSISRGCTHELVRHRVGVAISQRSTRYVDENESDWALHPLLHEFFARADSARRAPNGEATELTLSQVAHHVAQTAKQGYVQTVEKLQAWLIARGTDKFTARKQARGAARGLLGNALCTEMVWSCNVRSLRTILDQRAKAGADAEIRVLFNRIYEEALPYFPAYLQYEKRDCPDGIGYELFDPKSPAERLKRAEVELANLRAAQSAVDSPRLPA